MLLALFFSCACVHARHLSLSSIASGRFSKLQSSSVHDCYRKVLVGRSTLVRRCKWGTKEKFTYEFVLISLAVSCMFYLNGFRDGR